MRPLSVLALSFQVAPALQVPDLRTSVPLASAAGAAVATRAPVSTTAARVRRWGLKRLIVSSVGRVAGRVRLVQDTRWVPRMDGRHRPLVLVPPRPAGRPRVETGREQRTRRHPVGRDGVFSTLDE